MTPPSTPRLGAALWAAGMPGVLVLALAVTPQRLQGTPVPHGAAIAASLVQSGVLLALAAWLGAALARPLGLKAPVAEAALCGTGLWDAVKPQLLPSARLGLAAGAALHTAGLAAPPELQQAGAALHIPVAARLLYGGITEEILLRWGLMTLLAWLPWRFLQRRAGRPRARYMAAATLVAALFFAIGHFPAAAAMGVPFTPATVGYLLAANSVPGLLFGLAYWRWGLESACIAHAGAHLVALAAGA